MIKCLDPFKNLNISSRGNKLEISPCCLHPVHATDKIDFYKDINLTQLRQDWAQGTFPASCNSCKISEDQFGYSRRTGSNSWYMDNDIDNTDVELVRLDYWTGDLCNLSCAICSPANSTVWKKELNLHTNFRKAKVNAFWKDIDLSRLKFIHFNGGEPLLSKEHVEFLQAVPNKHNVHIDYNTNGTILPSKPLLDLWENFKLVQLDFSIDDIEQRFEYQRYPAVWSEVADNLQWYIDYAPNNCMFAVNTTVSVLNQHNLNNLDRWLAANFNSNRFTDKVECKKQLAFGILSTKNTNLSRIKIYLDSLDRRRGTNWQQTFPELIDYLKA